MTVTAQLQLQSWLANGQMETLLVDAFLGWPHRDHHFGFFMTLPSESGQRLKAAPWKMALTDPDTFFSKQTHF